MLLDVLQVEADAVVAALLVGQHFDDRADLVRGHYHFFDLDPRDAHVQVHAHLALPHEPHRCDLK